MKLVSIHLMLLFIPDGLPELTGSIQFQYISCCYLSEMEVTLVDHLVRFNTSHVVIYQRYRMEESMERKSFNTSHVVIYPPIFFIKRIKLLFQYISCCYLSNSLEGLKNTIIQFQYISCCYLSFLHVSSL